MIQIKKTLRFNFYDLDDAISFAEDLNSIHVLYEVLEHYIIQYGGGK